MSPLERVAALMTLMRELEDLMRAEGALLREMRLGRLRAIQDSKAALADAYEVALRRFRTEPEMVAALDADARATLEDGMRRFRAAAHANDRQLAAARRVVEGVVRALGDSLAANRGTGAYRPGPGTYPAAGRGAQILSLALNRNV